MLQKKLLLKKLNNKSIYYLYKKEMEGKFTTIQIIREYDKINLLETYLINNNLENCKNIISNLIDCIIQQDNKNIINNIFLLKKYINEPQPNKIITIKKIVYSIAEETPFDLYININKLTIKYINYINQSYVPFI
jgi:hypothetical protein